MTVRAALAGTMLEVARRSAQAAVDELRAAQKELIARERYLTRARARLSEVQRTARYPEASLTPARVAKEAADRVLRAQRRLVRAQRDADAWTVELEQAAIELWPIVMNDPGIPTERPTNWSEFVRDR